MKIYQEVSEEIKNCREIHLSLAPLATIKPNFSTLVKILAGCKLGIQIIHTL